MKVERASVRFVGQWVLASTLGWIGGALVGQGVIFWVIRPIGRALGLLAGIAPFEGEPVGIEGLVGMGVTMAGVGAGVGIMQSRVLRRQFSHGSRWVVASTIGWAMGGCLGGAIGWWPPVFLAVIAAGLGTGIMQWLILRRQFSQTGWWILASTVAWGVGMAVGVGAGESVVGLVSLITFIVGLVVPGAITGIALVWLMHPQEMRFRHKLGYIASVGMLLIVGTALQVNVQLQEKKEINALIQQLGNEDKEARRLAAGRLGMFGGRAKDAVPALIELLSNEDEHLRQSTASALGSIGKPAKDAVPALLESLNDESEYVHIEAASALGRIDKSNLDMILSLLIEALGSENEGIRANAASALGGIGSPAKEAVPALAALLSDESESVRHNATNALRQIGTSEALKIVKEYQQK